MAQAVEASRQVIAMGAHAIVLQSGEDPWYDADTICEMITKIKNNNAVAITLSIGERTREEYLLLHESGADRFLLKHETADRKLFNNLPPGRDFKKRLECLQ